MVQDLTNKVIWVTGATSGIGEAAAVHLSQQGARVVASGGERNVSRHSLHDYPRRT